VLHIVCLVHLRDELARGGEFSIGRPYFGFAVAGSYQRRKSRRGATTTCSTIPPEATHALVSRRARERSPT